MDLFDDDSGSFFLGFCIGAGLTYFGRDVIEQSGRPLAKAALKAGLVTYEKGRRYLTRATEELEDLMVEIIAERQMRIDDVEAPDVEPASSHNGDTS